jgi:hypothetical protein
MAERVSKKLDTKTDFNITALPYNSNTLKSRRFTSQSSDSVVAAIHWMIAQLPTEMERAKVRVALALAFRHGREEQ